MRIVGEDSVPVGRPDMESLEIRTERLLIVPLEEEMAENVHLNSLDEDTRRFVPDEVFATVDQAREVIRSLRECYRSAAGPFVFAVLLHSGENIGYVQAVVENSRRQP